MKLDDLLNNILGYAVAAALLAVVLSLASCQAQKQAIQGLKRDSVRVEYRLDSVRVYERDSIYIDRYRSNDTVWLTTERWSVRWRDKEVQVHDTITVAQEQTIVQVEKYVPGFYKWCTAFFWIIVLVVLGYTALKIYLKIQSGGLL